MLKKILIIVATFSWFFYSRSISDVYLYELYLHNEYIAYPPGLPSKVVIAPIVTGFQQKLDDGFENRLYAGTIGSLRLAHKHLWLECTTALAKENMTFKHGQRMGKRSRAGFDDVLIDAGYNFLLAEGKLQILVHLLSGFPAYMRVSRDEIEQPLVGTRTINMGPVIELAYDITRTEREDLFIALITRALHRFGRRYYPILPDNATFHPGNVTDLVLLLQYRLWGHRFEIGYNPTFTTNASYHFPHISERLPSQVLSSWYAYYTYYSKRLAMSFETGAVGAVGSKTRGWTWWALVGWYF